MSEAEPRKRTRLRSWIVTPLFLALALVTIPAALLFFRQHSFIYHPRKYAAGYERVLPQGAVPLRYTTIAGNQAKIPLLPSAVRWHFIGHLQKNKIRHALPLFEVFHSVDSLALAQDVQRIADEEGVRPRVLLEVNVSGEGSKFGFAPEKLKEEMEALLQFGRLEIEGVMTIPPFAPDAEDSRLYFIKLRELRDELEQQFAMRLPQLSMGMSNDYEVAIEEGATYVRVGTAIFGER